MYRQSTIYRSIFIILFLIGVGTFAPTQSFAQRNPDKVLQTKKEKKKPKKNRKKIKKKKPDGQDVDRLGTPPPRIEYGPGSFGRKDGGALPQKTIPGKQDEGKIVNRRSKSKAQGGTEGTNYKGDRAPSLNRPPGKVYEKPRKRDVEQNTELYGTQSPGRVKRKKARIDKPGRIYNDKEQAKLSRNQRDNGTSYKGDRAPSLNRPPGQVYETPRARDVEQNTELYGTQSQGRIKRKKARIDKPGRIYNDKEQAKLSHNQRDRGTQYTGDKAQPYSRRKPGDVYEKPRMKEVDEQTELIGTTHQGRIKLKEKPTPNGTHWSDRKVRETPMSIYQGNIKVKGKIKEPGTHWSERKGQPSEVGQYQGKIAAMSRKKKARFYGDISQKQQQYEGNIKLKKPKHDNLHPSAAATMTAQASSHKQVDKARNRSRLFNKLFRKKEQPPSVKEKKHKPRYDRNESDIWTQ